jgi:membrane protein DedA with SNARE-associated domain
MEEFFNHIIDFLLPRNDIFLYIFLFLSSVVENLVPPIPGDTITVFGAFLVGTGRLNYFFVFLSTTAGSVTGFMFLVFLGRVINREFFIKRNFKFFSTESIISAERWFERYGYLVVLANRFFPGIRSVISLVSGITRPLPGIFSGFMWGFSWETTGKP